MRPHDPFASAGILTIRMAKWLARTQGASALRSSDVAHRTWWRTLFRDAGEREFPHQLPPGCYYDAEL